MRQHNDRPRKLVAGRFTAISILTLTAWSLVGCTTLVPVSGATPLPLSGTVRLSLTAAGTASMRDVLGNDVREVEGVVVRSSADSLVLVVAETLTGTNQRFVSMGDTVSVARPLIESMKVQQYSRKRSVGLALAIASIVIGTLIGITVGSSGASGTGQPGTPQP